MSQDDELSEQQFGMETRKLEIRYRRGIYLIDITPAEGSKSLVAVILLKQLSLRQRGTTEILERPYIHLLSLRQDLLRTHRQTSAVLIVLEDITGVGILQQNTDSTLTSRHIPYVARFLSVRMERPFGYLAASAFSFRYSFSIFAKSESAFGSQEPDIPLLFPLPSSLFPLHFQRACRRISSIPPCPVAKTPYSRQPR